MATKKSKQRACALGALFWLLAGLWGACSSSQVTSSVTAASTRLLVGALAPTPGLDFSEVSALYLTRGGRYTFGAVGTDGTFFLSIPIVGASGALALVRQVVLATDPQGNPTRARLELVAQLVADTGTGEGLIAFEPGVGDVLLGPAPNQIEPLSVDLVAGTLALSSNPGVGILFTPGPYAPAQLCADSLATDCPLSGLWGCNPGPCLARIATGAVINECDPCGSAPLNLGPLAPVLAGPVVFAVDRSQGPLPDLIAPYPGLVLTGLRIRIPPVEQGGRLLPAIDLDLGAQPGLFFSDPADPGTFGFTFEDGERFSADDLFPIEIPALPLGSEARIEVRYRTNLGEVITVVCAPGSSAPECGG